MATTRRQFLAKLGLGAGACILNPLADSLFSQAMGQSTSRQKLIIGVIGNAMDCRYTPTQFGGTNAVNDVGNGNSYAYDTNFTWPLLLRAWEPYKQYALIADRFNIINGDGNHNIRYVLQGKKGSSTSGYTIDQQLAAGKMSEGVPIPVVNFGMRKQTNSRRGELIATPGDTDTSTFTGVNSPITYVVRPALLEKQIFGNAMPGTVTPMGGSPTRKRILDHVHQDAIRLQKQLGTEERVKLDEYLVAIADYDKKVVAQETISCDRPQFAFDNLTPEQNFSLMCQMSALALKCGMTNIVGMSMCNQTSDHGGIFPEFSFWKDLGLHSPDEHANGKDYQDQVHLRIMDLYLGELVKMLELLSGQKGVMPADTTVMLVTTPGRRHQSELHHGSPSWVPVFMLSSNPRLRTGGGFVRYDSKAVPLGALYVTLSHALGAPLASFGDWNKGPLPDLLV